MAAVGPGRARPRFAQAASADWLDGEQELNLIRTAAGAAIARLREQAASTAGAASGGTRDRRLDQARSHLADTKRIVSAPRLDSAR